MECEVCGKGKLERHDTWYRYKTPFMQRLWNEPPIYGTIYKCNNEDCGETFYNDGENEDLKQGYPC